MPSLGSGNETGFDFPLDQTRAEAGRDASFVSTVVPPEPAAASQAIHPVNIVGELPSFWRVAGVVGLGFLPVAEGNVAVPVALALGISPVLAVFLSVLGTTTQTLLVRALAGWLFTLPRVAGWWERHLAARAQRFFARGGATWVILLGIPWLGGTPTALGAQLAGVGPARYARWAISGLILHAATLALLIRLGLHAAGKR